jgi:hypothetical protein
MRSNSEMRKAKTNRNFRVGFDLKGGLSTNLRHKINEQDSVQNFELSSFRHEYVQGFREMDVRQKLRKLLFTNWECKLSEYMDAMHCH